MKGKIAKNYFYNVIYQVVSLLTPIITAPYMARTLQAEAIGINNYTNSIVYWFTLIGMLGIRLYGQKEIAKVRDDFEKMSRKFFEIFFLQLITNGISVIAFYGIYTFVPVQYKTVLLVQGIIIISIMFDISWFYYGIENIKQITIRDLVVKVLNVCAIFIFVKSPHDLALFVGITALFSLLSQLIMWFGVRKYIHFIRIKFHDIMSHLKETIILFIPQIAISIYSTLDKTMLGLLSDQVSEVAFYTQSYRFVHMFLFVVTSIGTVMMPRLVNLNANQEKEKSLMYCKKTFRISLMLSLPIAFGLAGVARYFIPWFLTEEFTKSGILIMILSVTIIFISLTNVLGMQILIPMEKTKEYTISVTCGAIINFLLNLCLIPHFTSYGATVATVIAEATIFIIEYYFVRKLVSLKKEWLAGIRYLVYAILMFIVVILIGKWLGVSVLTNVIQVLVGGLIYFGFLFITKDETFYMLISMAKRFLKRG